MKRLLILPLVLVFAAACGGGAPTGTATPTGTALPTAPAGATATPTLPPDGATLPPNASSGACLILTTAEVGAVTGEPMVVLASSDESCTYSASSLILPSITVRFDEGDSREGARFILSNAEELTVGGNPALFGSFAGHLLFIVKGGNTLVFQAIWSEQDNAVARTKLVQLGELAIGRFPLP
jgi:hypothetical protein